MEKEALLYEKLSDNIVNCFLCSHHCKISPQNFGICGVRQNLEGVLYTLAYGEVIAEHIDPIEKKPLYHFLPGSSSYSIAAAGCNFKCGFCQNWQISQLSKRNGDAACGRKLLPEEVVKLAIKNKCLSISYTYTEPTIFFEYALDTAKLAQAAGIYNVFVTNGYMTKAALDMISPYLDAANVDLKSYSDDYYRNVCHGHLSPVLESIKYMKKLGIWVEITTLVVPGKNDGKEELTHIAKFISGISPDIPWHISRFHPDYQFADYDSTPIEILRTARQIGKECGLHYVYLGNTLEGSDTHCPGCNTFLIRRTYFNVDECFIKNRRCSQCSAKIAGVWR